jgi:hypothetical protein
VLNPPDSLVDGDIVSVVADAPTAAASAAAPGASKARP